MYADRYAPPAGIKSGSLIVAVAVNAGVIGALVFVTPVFEVIKRDRPLITTNVPIDPPPPPEPLEMQPQRSDRTQARPEQVSTSTSIVPINDSDYLLPPPLPPLPPLPSVPPVEFATVQPPVAPVLVEAQVDPRYAGDLQPTYPAGERRAGREGFATVRVSIGGDGRVSAAECLSATSEDFCRTTRAQALSKWRFRPATRDGAAITASKVMTVRFKLQS